MPLLALLLFSERFHFLEMWHPKTWSGWASVIKGPQSLRRQFVIEPGLCKTQQVKCWDIKVCSREKVYSQGSQARRWDNKSPICPPEGEGLRIFMGQGSGVVWGVERDAWRQEKAKQWVFCAGLYECHASSWDACSENGSVSMIWGGRFGLLALKSHPLVPWADPGRVLSCLTWTKLAPPPWKTICYRCYSNPCFRGVSHRGQLKESCGVLSKPREAWWVCSLQEQSRHITGLRIQQVTVQGF